MQCLCILKFWIQNADLSDENMTFLYVHTDNRFLDEGKCLSDVCNQKPNL